MDIPSMDSRIYHNFRLVNIELKCFLSKIVGVLSFIFLLGLGVFMQFFRCNFGVLVPKRLKPKISVNFGDRTADSIASILKCTIFLNLGCTVRENVLDFQIVNVWVLEKLRQRTAWTKVSH